MINSDIIAQEWWVSIKKQWPVSYIHPSLWLDGILSKTKIKQLRKSCHGTCTVSFLKVITGNLHWHPAVGGISSAWLLKFCSEMVSVMTVAGIKSRIQWHNSINILPRFPKFHPWYQIPTPFIFRQCSECDQASSDDADIAMETLPDGTKRSRRQIKGPIKFIPQEMSPEPKKHQVRAQADRPEV